MQDGNPRSNLKEDYNGTPHNNATASSTSNEKLKVRNISELKQPTKKSHASQKLVAGKSKFKCATCGTKFENYPSIQDHLKAQSCNLFCDACKIYVLASEMVEHDAWHARRNTCKLCGESFATNEALSEHVWSHGDKTHVLCVCNVCGSRFSRTDTFTTHTLVHSSVSKQDYLCVEKECVICKRKFLCFHHKKSSVRDCATCLFCAEMKRKKYYKCVICDFSFSKEDLYKTHLEFHKMRFKMKCTVCNAVLNNEYEFYYHRKSHEGGNCKKIKIEREEVSEANQFEIKQEVFDEIECEETIITNLEEPLSYR